MFKEGCRWKQKVLHQIDGRVNEATDARGSCQQRTTVWILQSLGGPILLCDT